MNEATSQREDHPHGKIILNKMLSPYLYSLECIMHQNKVEKLSREVRTKMHPGALAQVGAHSLPPRELLTLVSRCGTRAGVPGLP